MPTDIYLQHVVLLSRKLYGILVGLRKGRGEGGGVGGGVKSFSVMIPQPAKPGDDIFASRCRL